MKLANEETIRRDLERRGDACGRLRSCEIDTPLGAMLAVADDERLQLLEFADCQALESELAWIKRQHNAVIAPGANSVLEQIEQDLERYFANIERQRPSGMAQLSSGVAQLSDLCSEHSNAPGATLTTKTSGTGVSPVIECEAPPVFSTPIAIEGTPFQTAVWRELLNIPHGQTRSYADIARAIGNPKAVRAVGRANGANRLCIIVPCHRVVATDGSLSGYGGGRWRKEWLLEHEQRGS